MNDLMGLQAICVALAQPEASFNFNPLILSLRRSIDPSLQRAVSELFGCWDESALQIENTRRRPLDTPAGTAPRTLSGRRSDLLALPPGPSSSVQKRSLLLVAAVVIVVGLSTVIAVTGGFNNNHQAATAPLPQAQTPAAPVVTLAETPKASPNAVARVNRPNAKRRSDPGKKGTPRLLRRIRNLARVTTDQGRDADREWACVESVNR